MTEVAVSWQPTLGELSPSPTRGEDTAVAAAVVPINEREGENGWENGIRH